MMNKPEGQRGSRWVTLLLFACFCSVPLSASPQVVEDLVHIKFQTDVRVFAAMAAINAAGFALDASSPAASTVRKIVRERLSAVDRDLLDRLREFYEAHNTEREDVARQGKYISFALTLTGPPQFSLAFPPADLPPDVVPLVGFEHLLADLWIKGGMQTLWEQVRPEYVREAEAYRPLLRNMIIDTLKYLRMEPRVALDRQVVFIPDLLNGQGVVNARNIGNDYIVIVGPSPADSRPMRSLRHEYLHFLIDPLVSKYFGYLPPAEPYLKVMKELPGSRAIYLRDFTLMVTESLIEMAELRLDREPEKRVSSMMAAAYSKGLVLAPWFLENLRLFEERQDAFQEFFPAMIKGIEWEVESKRAAAIAQIMNREESRAAQEGGEKASDAVRQAESRALLSQANQLLANKDFDKAAAVLEEVLRMDPLNPGALFGMAQIAAQAQEFERALALYEKAAGNADEEGWIAGWSLVRRGNIYRFLGDPEKARAEWQKALALEGNLRGAREAAEQALKKLAIDN